MAGMPSIPSASSRSSSDLSRSAEGRFSCSSGKIVQQVLALIAAGVLQAGDVQAADLHQPFVILFERNLQFRGDLLFGGRALQALFRRGDGRFDLLGLAALLPRRPVQAAQAVQDGAADLVFRIGLQLDVVARVEVVDGRNQADDAGRHQVFQADVLRQPLLDPPGNQPHLRQMLQDEPFPLVVADHFRHRIRVHTYRFRHSRSDRASRPPPRAPGRAGRVRISSDQPARGWRPPDLPGCAARW